MNGSSLWPLINIARLLKSAIVRILKISDWLESLRPRKALYMCKRIGIHVAR